MKTIQKAFNRISSIAEEAAKYEFSNQFATLRSELMKAFSFIEPKKARGIGALNAPVREIERLMQDLKSASLSQVESIVSQIKNKKIEVEQSLKTIEDDIDIIDRMTNSIKQELKPLEALAIEMGGKPQQVPLWKQGMQVIDMGRQVILEYSMLRNDMRQFLKEIK